MECPVPAPALPCTTSPAPPTPPHTAPCSLEVDNHRSSALPDQLAAAQREAAQLRDALEERGAEAGRLEALEAALEEHQAAEAGLRAQLAQAREVRREQEGCHVSLPGGPAPRAGLCMPAVSPASQEPLLTHPGTSPHTGALGPGGRGRV